MSIDEELDGMIDSVNADDLLNKWIDIVSRPDPPSPKVKGRDQRRRRREAKRWGRRGCQCGLCDHRIKGVRWQYVVSGRHCACGYCNLDDKAPDCAVTEWQYTL